jgi:hypothetical protein
MCQINLILLISYQEELRQQHYQPPHDGGKDHSGWHKSHLVGLPCITEFNNLTEILEIRNVNVAVQPPEDITQRFSKLKRLIRVIAYCRSFINNCRHSKANRQIATLTTQDLDQALTCCVKMVQQISYAQKKSRIWWNSKRLLLPVPLRHCLYSLIRKVF